MSEREQPPAGEGRGDIRQWDCGVSSGAVADGELASILEDVTSIVRRHLSLLACSTSEQIDRGR
jgi:hypothetical protein